MKNALVYKMVTINHIVGKEPLKRVKSQLVKDNTLIDFKDKNGWTPLHKAVGNKLSPYRKEKLVRLLLDRGADRNAKTHKGETPYDIAVRYHCPKRIRDLVKATLVSEIYRMEDNDTPSGEMLEKLSGTISTIEELKIYYTLVSAHSKIMKNSKETVILESKKRELLKRVFLQFSMTYPFGGTNTIEIAKFKEILCKAKRDNIIIMKEQFVYEQHANRNDIYNSNHFLSLREQIALNTANIGSLVDITKNISKNLLAYQEHERKQKEFKRNLKIGGGFLKLFTFGFGTGAVDILEGVAETLMDSVVDFSDVKEIENVIVSKYEALGLSESDRDQMVQTIINDIDIEYSGKKAYIAEFIKISKRVSEIETQQRGPIEIKLDEMEYRFLEMEKDFKIFRESSLKRKRWFF